uniref:Uncharacterized protein n=1 Tax=Arundo donax TaxID=35708 RepID=A0A0A9B134_ARUDO
MDLYPLWYLLTCQGGGGKCISKTLTKTPLTSTTNEPNLSSIG